VTFTLRVVYNHALTYSPKTLKKVASGWQYSVMKGAEERNILPLSAVVAFLPHVPCEIVNFVGFPEDLI